jgi:hypothetical protein
MSNNDFFVFTEAYNCGTILKIALDSFHKYHDEKVHIFGTYKDFKKLTKHKNNVFIELSEDEVLKNLYMQGHIGTAYIFSKVINGEYTKINKIIHFDSDVVFRSECLSLIKDSFNKGYDLIGSRRCYKNNLNGRSDLSQIEDVVQTYFFGFNKEKINNYSFNELINMCVGYYNPYKHPILDFFDPVSFDIINNGGKIDFLDYNLVGGMNENGDKNNKYGEVNQKIDFGDLIVHFAGVGSGMNFFNNKSSADSSYQEWAKKQYFLYHKLFYKEELSQDYDKEKYETIKFFLENETSNK